MNNVQDENALVQFGRISGRRMMKIIDRLLGIFGRHRIALDAASSEDPMKTQIQTLRARLFLKLTGKNLIEPSLDDISKKADLSGLTDNLSPSRRLARRET